MTPPVATVPPSGDVTTQRRRARSRACPPARLPCAQGRRRTMPGNRDSRHHAGRRSMPPPQGKELEEIRARRQKLREKYMRGRGERPATTVQGVHHLALICKNVEETIQFYQEFLGFPLVELVENRDYAGSSHFFFDIGNRNMLGFFDFPGHQHPPFEETIGGVQHLAISISPAQFDAAKKKLDEAGVDYLGPDRGVEESMYFRDPNGVNVELYREELGIFDGRRLLD